MFSHRVRRTSAPVCGALGLLAISAAATQAANLLTNPGFESPTDTSSNESTNINGWTVIPTAKRDAFQNHTPGGRWSVWARTFEPLGGGVSQNVSGVSAGTDYSFSSYIFFEPGYFTITDPVSARISLTFLDSGNNQVGSPTNLDLLPSTPGLMSNVWTQFTLSGVTAPVGATQVKAFVGWTDGGPGTGGQSVFFDDVDLEGAGVLPASTWNVNTSGDWNTADNWANILVPNGAGAQANFFGAISAPKTVYADTPVTVGSMNFNNANMYVIAGSSSLTIQTSSGNGQINVTTGGHKINLPLFFASNTDITVAGGATLTIADPMTINANRTVNKTGSVIISAPVTIQSGGVLNLVSGSTTVFGAPGIAAGAKIDVRNNSMTVDYRGQASPAATIRAQLVAGYAGGAWNGTGGINTSQATSSIGLGWLDDASSQSINIKYAYYGDANLDGIVDTIDFNLLAANFSGTSRVWGQGDFNYDQMVDTVDFNLLASNFSKTLPASELAGALVPEPASLGLLAAIGGIGILPRRRK